MIYLILMTSRDIICRSDYRLDEVVLNDGLPDEINEKLNIFGWKLIDRIGLLCTKSIDRLVLINHLNSQRIELAVL